MEVKREYFLDEVRDGYYVPGTMKKAWAAGISGYRKLDEVCTEEGVRCYAMFGTLLGAVRNGGCIPWDDDIDTEMYRAEFDRIRARSDAGKLPGEYHVVGYAETEGQNLARKWVDSHDIIKKTSQWAESFGFPFLSSIDIFISDSIPTDRSRNPRYREIITAISILKNQAMVLYESDVEEVDEAVRKRVGDITEKEFRRGLKEVAEATGFRFDLSSEETVLVQILRCYDHYIGGFLEKDFHNRGIVSYYMNHESLAFPDRLYADFIDMEFEMTTIRVPIGYDGILRRFYGNYMYPAHIFDGHSYPFYSLFEKAVREFSGIEFLHYHLYEEDIRGKLQEKTSGGNIIEQVTAGIEVLREAQRYIAESVKSRSTEEADVIRELLGQCQEMAIGLGTRLEQKTVHPEKWIKLLEEYCETAYQLYQIDLALDESAADMARGVADLERLTDALMGICDGKPEEMREVLFFPVHAGHWGSLHSLWKRYQEDEHVLVRVIPVPYFYRDYDGKLLTEEMQIETDGYPDEVELTDYNTYDFEACTADVAIIQCPHDEYSDVMSVHPFFYSSSLIRYVGKLVLIPEFVLREIAPGDARSRVTLDTYIRTPGMIYTDKIIVQSESMREVYIELLNRFVEDEWKDRVPEDLKDAINWTEKVSGAGSPLYDKQLEDMRKSRENRGKKRIAYHVSGSQLYESGRAGIEKMKEVLAFLAERGDEIETVIYLDRYAEQILGKSSPDIWQEYLELVDEYKGRAGVYINDTYDDETASDWVDAVYGDGCRFMNRCRMKGKPALLAYPGIPVERSSDGRNWDESICVAAEVNWSLGSFLEAVLAYEIPEPAGGNAERIFEMV